MALPQRLIDAERALYIADDDLRAALAHGSEEEKERAQDAWRKALREKRAAAQEALQERVEERLKLELKRALSKFDDLSEEDVEQLSGELLNHVVEFVSPKCALCNQPEHKHGEGYDRFGVPKGDHMNHRFSTAEEVADWERNRSR